MIIQRITGPMVANMGAYLDFVSVEIVVEKSTGEN